MDYIMKNSRKYRFVEYETDIWLIVGIGYDSQTQCEVFEIVPIQLHINLFRANISVESLTIPMDSVMEIADPDIINSILMLYK